MGRGRRVHGRVGGDPRPARRRINGYARERRSARDVGEMLLRLGRYAKECTGRRAAGPRGPGALARVAAFARGTGLDVRGEQNPEEHRMLMTEAVDALPVDTVVELAQGDQRLERTEHFALHGAHAAEARRPGEGIGGRGAHGDSELRDAAREIVDNWTLEDPNPLEHTRLLDQLSQFEVSKVEGTVPLTGEGLRLMQIAIETNASGDHVLGSDRADARGAGADATPRPARGLRPMRPIPSRLRGATWDRPKSCGACCWKNRSTPSAASACSTRPGPGPPGAPRRARDLGVTGHAPADPGATGGDGRSDRAAARRAAAPRPVVRAAQHPRPPRAAQDACRPASRRGNTPSIPR